MTTRAVLSLLRGSPWLFVWAMVGSVASGVMSIQVIAMINRGLAARSGGAAGPTWWAFAGLCLAVLTVKTFAEILLVRMGQRIAGELRRRLSRQLLDLPLRRMEELGPARAIAVLTDDVGVVTAFTMFVPQLVVSAVVVAGSLVYLATLSLRVTALIVVFTIVGVITYELPTRWAIRSLRKAREATDRLHRQYRALTDGFKELKLHAERRERFLSTSLDATVDSLERASITGFSIQAAGATWGQLLFLLVIGLLILGLGEWLQLESTVLIGTTLTVLYMRAPLETILSVLPSLSRTRVALGKIEQLGLTLAAEPRVAARPLGPPDAWTRIELIGIRHTYPGEDGSSRFQLGPLDLRLRRGEVVFLSGGNGSGKTTLAKILTGLYVPDAGDVRVDACTITDETRDAYRHYFAMVFADAFLFDELLAGPDRVDDERARTYLTRLQLDRHVTVRDGVFSTLQLSQGQRKRLALLAAYVEERPIYVFDEWAADQDPAFKRVFYTELIPDLKARGKTVIAITHDDRYYHCADRLLKLDAGQLVDEVYHQRREHVRG